MANSFEDWWHNLGDITKYLALYVVATSTGITTGVLSPAYIAVYVSGPTSWLQMLYRPLTAAFCFGSFSMNWLMTVPTFISFLNRNERSNFSGKPVDFIWMLLFLAYSTGALALALGFYWTNFSMLLALCWVHCKLNPGERTSFFGFEFKSAYFPWVLVAFNFIVSQSLMPELVGIAAGHSYVFLQTVLPATHGKRLLDTPQWMCRLMGRLGLFNQAPQHGGFQAQQPNPQQRQQQAGAHAWGRGRTLGAG